MSTRIQHWLDRYLGGVRWRPLWLSMFAAAMLIAYVYQGQQWRPEWFFEWGPSQLFGVRAPKLDRFLWSHLTGAVTLLVAPLAVCWLVEGWRPSELGFRLRGTGREFALVLGMWAAFLPVVWWVSRFPSFQATYPAVPAAARDPKVFAAHELLYLTKWVSWEFFFRGFMLFGLRKDLGGAAILLSTVPFAVMHCIGKPQLEALGAIGAGLVLCAIALSSRSIWPGVLLHWLVATSMDFFAADWWR
jgi:membrane protease YdiL (CAAX protease family)